jgi:cellulose biosynthesis protein BcsQ
MDAIALTARFPLTRTRPRGESVACGLSFDIVGGPLVAVCGLVGGSGATTLALCLARQAARESRAPVLLTEAASQRAGLTVLAGASTPHSLSTLAQELAAGQPPEHSFTELDSGLRLIAAAPQCETGADPQELRALLDEARAAHGMVIVDCGADWTAAAPVLERATHVLWTLPATRNAVARAHALFAGDALPVLARARENLVAVALTPRPDTRVRALRRLAAQRCERLVLIPYSEPLAHGRRPDEERTRRALTALGTTLRARTA